MKKEKNIINEEHKSAGLTPFAVDISDFATKLLGKKGLCEIKILTAWNSIVGDDLAKYSVPERIYFAKGKRDNGILHLVVANGSYALQIGHKTTIILEKINTFFGYNAVSQIKISQNEAPFHHHEETIFEDKANKKLVSDQEQNYIIEITKDVKNLELKKRLQSLGENIFKQDK